MEIENEELKLELLPAAGLLTLKQLAMFLGANSVTVRTNLEKKGIKMLPYQRGKFIISLGSIDNYLKEQEE